MELIIAIWIALIFIGMCLFFLGMLFDIDRMVTIGCTICVGLLLIVLGCICVELICKVLSWGAP